MFILGDFQCELADKNKHQNMDFLSLFMSKWDEIHDKSDVFRYKIDKIREKVVSGYLLQVQKIVDFLLQSIGFIIVYQFHVGEENRV